MSDLVFHDLAKTGEIWREYDFGSRIYRIVGPTGLWFRPDGSTHRVLDSLGVVHLVPASGHQGCVVRWQKGEGREPVDF